jgi:hypothetical protein
MLIIRKKRPSALHRIRWFQGFRPHELEFEGVGKAA